MAIRNASGTKIRLLGPASVGAYVNAVELTDEERAITDDINRLQQDRFEELDHLADKNSLKEELFGSATDNIATHIKTSDPSNSNNFWLWLMRMQGKDEACCMILQVMRCIPIDEQHQADDCDCKRKKCALTEVGRKAQATLFQGKERESIMQIMNHQELDHLWPKEKEDRAERQLVNFRALKRLYVQGYIPDLKPLHVGKVGKGAMPLIIPLDSQIQVIQCTHHSPGTFHLGVNRTEMVLRDFAYFPKMIQVISEYIKRCDQCQQGKILPCKLSPGLGKTSSLEWYSPIEGELVDYRSSIDPDSTDRRKL